VAAVLESLCRKGASGVLEVEGNPAGAIYLDQGQITFARSSWAPDLTARLCGALRPPPELRNFLRGSDQADRNSGALLVRRGYMSENDVRSILRSAVIDALIVLTMPLVGGSSVLDIRFEAPSGHWAAAFLRLSLESVQPDVSRRAAQMTRVGIAHTAPIALRDLDRPSAMLTRSQWAIASRVDGTLSPRDLARQSGLSLYETIISLGALIRRGLCAPAGLASPGPGQPAPGATVSSVPPARAATTPVPPDALTRLVTRTAAPSRRHRTSPAVPAQAAPSPAETAPAPNGSADHGRPAPAPKLNGAGQNGSAQNGAALNAPADHGRPASAPAPNPAERGPVGAGPNQADPLAPAASGRQGRPTPSAYPTTPTPYPAGPGTVPPLRPAPDGTSPDRSPDAASASTRSAINRRIRPGHPAPATPNAAPDWPAPAPSRLTPATAADAAAFPAPPGPAARHTFGASSRFGRPVDAASFAAAPQSAAPGDPDPHPGSSRSTRPADEAAFAASPRPAAGDRDTLAGSPRPVAPGNAASFATSPRRDGPGDSAAFAAPRPATLGDAAAYATSGAPATSATWDTTDAPTGRPSFTPAATPTPLTSPELSGRPVVSAAAVPGPQKPAVDPAPVDVPAGAVGSPVPPSYPAYRRSPQQQWPLSEAPVPPATPGGSSPATSDADAQWAVPARAAAAGGYPARASRGAHRADPSSRPETGRNDRNDRTGRNDRTEAAAPPWPKRQPMLPQRRPGHRVDRGQAATQPIPVPDGWPQGADFSSPPESVGAYVPARPLQPVGQANGSSAGSARSGGGAESEDFIPAAPDLLRRVLEGLRRLG
jgi:hypothetical protein